MTLIVCTFVFSFFTFSAEGNVLIFLTCIKTCEELDFLSGMLILI